MKEKWNKKSESKNVDSQMVTPGRITYLHPEPLYRPKLLLKSPSMRAINNYHNLSLRESNNYDNLTFIPESGNAGEEPYPASIISGSCSTPDTLMYNTYDTYDYANTIRSSSGRSAGSEVGSEGKAEMGSTVKLVQNKVERSLKSWCGRLDAVLCTVALAANLGNLYRLPLTALTHGGLPFLAAYALLAILVGLPLVFLELGIGQLAQEGMIKCWRVLPFFRGIGYVKLLAGCLLSIYYPLHMGLALYYVIWLSKDQTVPFKECMEVRITEGGYSADGISSEKCLEKTFLKPPLEDPFWYGIFAAILFFIWIVIIILSIRRTKSFTRSLTLLLFPTVACYIALTVKAVTFNSNPGYLSTENFWNTLGKAHVWYYAAIQVFFSTNAGFGIFVTNAGIIYNRVNPLWTAISYIFINIILGIGSVFLCNILSGNDGLNVQESPSELYLIRQIYNISIAQNDDQVWYWALIAYLGILFAGFISMAIITFTLLKAITGESKRKVKWWQSSIVLSFTGFILGCAVLLQPDFQIVRLLDHYIVGNLILVTVIIEVLALMLFYGMERIKSDFEFMMGHLLSKVWILLWWTTPLILLGVFSWGLATLPLRGKDDADWLCGTGWGVVLVATLYIFIIGLRTVFNQDGYTFCHKLKSSLKPSSKWGPKDPILRHNWIQWSSKAQNGERDFTLKRRGTREYTRSVKKSTKKLNVQAASDLSTTTASGEYHKTGDIDTDIQLMNGTAMYSEPYYLSNNSTIIRITSNGNSHGKNEYSKPLRVTSLTDSMSYDPEYRSNINPLARSKPPNDVPNHENNTGGYGTFRKGPYIIEDNLMNHVCHKRLSQCSEGATEL